MRLFILLFCSFLITSCSTREGSDSDIDRYALKVNSYNSEVIAPIVLLTYASCIERHKTGKWPSIASPPGSLSLFSKYQEISDSPDYKIEILLKSSNIHWNINIKYISNIAADLCDVVIAGGTKNNASTFTLKETVKISDIEKYKNISLKDFESNTLRIAKLAYLPLLFAENNRPQKPLTETEKFTSQVSASILQVTFCLLFDVASGCSISTSNNETTTSIRKEQLHEKMHQQQEKFKEKLKIKLEEGKSSSP